LQVVIERYYPRLTLDFETNKRICDEIAVISSKRLRNKVRKLSGDSEYGHFSRTTSVCFLSRQIGRIA
jgi:hypothetical protein